MGHCKNKDGSCSQCCVLAGRVKCSIENLTGPTGADSTITGPTGPAGADGAPGESITGPTGPQGFTGPGGEVDATALSYLQPLAEIKATFPAGFELMNSSTDVLVGSNIYQSVIQDPFSIFNPGTFEIIIPEDGTYRISARLPATVRRNGLTNVTVRFIMRRNGSNFMGGTRIFLAAAAGSAVESSFFLQRYEALNAGDAIDFITTLTIEDISLGNAIVLSGGDTETNVLIERAHNFP